MANPTTASPRATASCAPPSCPSARMNPAGSCAQHQNPAEALHGFQLSGATWGIGHHWGTFQLTDEARDAPLAALDEALAEQNIPADRFRALAPGEAWAIPPA
ncbi:hypothetical protein OKA06_19540 [Novosphingobium sp. MW5]|nr:hypothetical protein [Novosphingobium sp. MW5]